MNTYDGERADVELTIQIGAETEAEILAILTQARKRAAAMLAAPHVLEMANEDQWCSSAMRVTVRRPHMGTER